MTFWKANLGRQKKGQGLQGAGGGRIHRQITEDFHGYENTLSDTIMMDTCYFTFVQTHLNEQHHYRTIM